jgi:hypothetical protein
MATKALTYVARRASLDSVAPSLISGDGRGWRAILFEQDAEAIWRNLSEMIRSVLPDQESDSDQITQEIFLHLIATDRLNLYIQRHYSDEEILQDLLSLIA